MIQEDFEMKKKIAVVLNTEPEWGGEHQYALTIMGCLIELRNDMIELIAVCRNSYWKLWCREHRIRVLNISWPSLTIREEKNIIRYPISSKIYHRHITELGKIIHKEKIDAIFVTDQGTFVPNMDVKVIAPVHDLMHRYEGEFPEVSGFYEERELIFSSKAKYAWCVLTDSKLGKRQFIESYSNCMRKKLTYIISIPFVVPNYIMEDKEEPIELPSKYVFYPAQFWQHKNHLNLLKAIQLLMSSIPDVHLVLVGSEKNALERIHRYILDNGLDNNVTIKGFVSNGNVIYLYKHAVALVMPSYFGPTNIPPLEAMALGCPVAVSSKYAMPEQVGTAGLLFDPDSPEEIAECIKKIWCDKELRQEMIRKGYDKVNKWKREDFAKKIQKIIQKL